MDCGVVDEETVPEEVVCGLDPDRRLEGIQKFVDAGFDHVYVHQVGSDLEGFLAFYERDVLPAARELSSSRGQAVRA
jgi:coenzyme F420-dependent glucose-6-phosphate dehydrogenase